jgi:hypothetical protein
MKFKRRHGEFEQGCVLSESYTVTDAVPPTDHLSRRYSQLVANRCCRLRVRYSRHRSSIETFFSENLFVNRGSTVLRILHIIYIT